MVQWEYYVTQQNMSDRWSAKRQAEELVTFNSVLNQAGANGWEMVSYESVPSPGISAKTSRDVLQTTKATVSNGADRVPTQPQTALPEPSDLRRPTVRWPGGRPGGSSGREKGALRRAPNEAHSMEFTREQALSLAVPA